jgi:hypothetical protein
MFLPCDARVLTLLIIVMEAKSRHRWGAENKNEASDHKKGIFVT